MAEPSPIIDRPATVTSRRDDDEIRAAIDLGTNSFHLVVARVDADGHLAVLEREKEVVRLGSGAGAIRRLTPDAIDRGLAALGRFRRIAESFGAEIDAVGTSALREAVNRDEFLARARAEGVDVDVVSGVEEARLIYAGVRRFVPRLGERILVIDIGGGSTELVVGRGNDVVLARSLKLGAIRLTDRFFLGGDVGTAAITECRTFVRSFLAPAIGDVRPHAPFTAVGSSGTILNLARMAAADDGRDPATVGSGDAFSVDHLRRVVAGVLDHRSADERATIVGLDERRRDIIVGGAILLDEVLDLLSIEELVVSDAALREGILVDRVGRRDAVGAVHRLGDVRRRSVMRMAETFHEDVTHIGRATDLALQLFDALAPVRGLSTADRDLLEAAGLLHNVGLFISHAAHHRHSYYVIRHTDQLVGFTDREVELIAQVARYHRKSAPKPSHPEFEALPDDDQRRVRILAGILRVAIALDRTRRGSIVSVAVRPTIDTRAPTAIDVDVRCVEGADVSLEQYTAEQRVGLLETALGATVRLHLAGPPADDGA